MGTTLFHVAPANRHERIMREGLRGQWSTEQGQELRAYPKSPEGVYLWSDYSSAENYANDQWEFGEDPSSLWRVYEINASDLPIKIDQIWHQEDPESKRSFHAWIYLGDIPSDRIRSWTDHGCDPNFGDIACWSPWERFRNVA